MTQHTTIKTAFDNYITTQDHLFDEIRLIPTTKGVRLGYRLDQQKSMITITWDTPTNNNFEEKTIIQAAYQLVKSEMEIRLKLWNGDTLTQPTTQQTNQLHAAKNYCQQAGVNIQTPALDAIGTFNKKHNPKL